MNKLIKKVLDDNQHISISTEVGRQIVTEKIMSTIRTEGGWFLNFNRDNDKPFLYPETKNETKLRVQAGSGHNDGWTKQYYKDKLSEDIVDDKEKRYIYESPDGGKTVYKRAISSKKRTLVKDFNNESNS